MTDKCQQRKATWIFQSKNLFESTKLLMTSNQVSKKMVYLNECHVFPISEPD